jgi:tRNA pseudouridine38-40 synthase
VISYALKLSYDGSAYAGWQRQINAMTVQETVESTWQKVFSESIKTTGASRTDAGVHARGQVAMFKSEKALTPRQMVLAMNSHLPDSIAVVDAVPVDEAFHARYGARGKHYTYRLATGLIRPVLERTTIVHQPATVDIDKVNELLRLLEGERDFTALMDQGSPSKRYVRRIYEAKASQLDERIDFSIKGDGFLYHMVRIIVGTALMVGRGKLSLTEVEANLSAKKRVGLGPTMPPGGLCLERVYYEQALFGDDSVDALLASMSER